MVPTYSLPGHVRFNDALDAGARGKLAARQRGSAGRRVPAVHRRHDRRVEGRDAHAPQPRRERAADRGLGAAGAHRHQPRPGAGAADLHLRAAALPRVRADRELPRRHPARHAERADREPARHPGLRRRSSPSTGSTCIPGVNTLFNALAENPDFQKLDFSSMRISNGGGMAVQQAVAEKWLKLTGVPIVEGYGLSETSPVATCNPIHVARVQRHDRPAVPEHRDRDPRRRGAAACRSASRARSRSAARR